MNSSSGKKIVRKVFYTTGSAVAKVEKFKDGFVDIAKAFKAGYHLLSDQPATSKPPGQQLDGLYGYFGKIIFENIENKNLSVHYNPGFEFLQSKAEGLMTEISPKADTSVETPKEKEAVKITTPVFSEVDLTKIQSQDPLVRLKSVVSLSRLNTPQARLALLSQSKDPDSLIRRVIVNCINPQEGEDEAFAIVKFINDPDEDVARIAMRKSTKIRNRLAFTYLISKLDSENVKLRQEAISALNLITGSDLGFNPASAVGQRNEAVKRWQQIWADNQTNAQFLIDEEATRSIFKKKYHEKIAVVEKKEAPIVHHAEPKAIKPDTHHQSSKKAKTSKDPSGR